MKTMHRYRRRFRGESWERRPKEGHRFPTPACAGSSPVAPAHGSVAQRIRAPGFYPGDEGSSPSTPARRNTTGSASGRPMLVLFQGSQVVRRSAVNRDIVGSTPSPGAMEKLKRPPRPDQGVAPDGRVPGFYPGLREFDSHRAHQELMMMIMNRQTRLKRTRTQRCAHARVCRSAAEHPALNRTRRVRLPPDPL